MEILILEDCIDTFNLIQTSLVPDSIFHVKNIQAAKAALNHQIPQLIILDINLPDGCGNRFCAELSNDFRFKKIPKIILTTNSSVNDKIVGLYSGADDYITKPFSPQELKARCDVRLRRQTLPNIYRAGKFEFNLEFQFLQTSEEDKKRKIELTPTEFKIMYLLATNIGLAFSREELVRKIWKESGTSVEARGVDTHISHLRRKLGRDSGCITCIYRVGYTFRAEAVL